MATCNDCKAPVVFLRKPDGTGWLKPVEPVLDFAYDEYFIATVDGTAAPMPQIYKKHVCMSEEERLLAHYRREKERRDLIEADRLRRAEAERIERERREYELAREEADRDARKRLEREERARKHREREESRRVEREAEERRVIREARRDYESWYERMAAQMPERLRQRPCRDCGAEINEACRTEFYGSSHRAHLWWSKAGHRARYEDAPPAPSAWPYRARWDDDYDHRASPVGHVKGSTPETVGPWPPDLRPTLGHTRPAGIDWPKRIQDGAGAYEMTAWLRSHYFDVFEPERRWISDEETRTLGDWLADHGDIFEEVQDDDESGRVAEDGAGAGTEGVRGGHAGSAGDPPAPGGGVRPDEPGGEGSSDEEHGDREGGSR